MDDGDGIRSRMIRKTKILNGHGWKLLIYCLYPYVKRQQTANRELFTMPDAKALDPLTFPEIRWKGRPYHTPTCRPVAYSFFSPCRAGVPMCQEGISQCPMSSVSRVPSDDMVTWFPNHILYWALIGQPKNLCQDSKTLPIVIC